MSVYILSWKLHKLSPLRKYINNQILKSLKNLKFFLNKMQFTIIKSWLINILIILSCNQTPQYIYRVIIINILIKLSSIQTHEYTDVLKIIHELKLVTMTHRYWTIVTSPRDREESMVWLGEDKVHSGKEDCPRDTSPDLSSSKAGPSALSLFWSQDIS